MVGPVLSMLRFARKRSATWLILAAYFAVHAIGALWHDQLHGHSHTADEPAACCHAKLCAHDAATPIGVRTVSSEVASSEVVSESELLIRSDSACDGADCVVCRLAGQPVVASQPVALLHFSELCVSSADKDPAVDVRKASRLAQSRAPPLLAAFFVA